MHRATRLIPLLMLTLAFACNPDADEDGVKSKEDCNDDNAASYPGNIEICDGIDNNCDGVVDEDTATDASVWYADTDGDGFGEGQSKQTSCEAPTGFVAIDGDCNDGNKDVNPDADEVCDGIDNDCKDGADGDDALDAPTWFVDADDDGLGVETTTVKACEMPDGYTDNADDCDDTTDIIMECCSAGDDLVVSGVASIEGGVQTFNNFRVEAGATLTVTGDEPLQIYANNVDISGTIDISGGDGGDSDPAAAPDGGDAFSGGGGGGGGGDCGNGPGAGGSPNGGLPILYPDGQPEWSQGGPGGLPIGVSRIQTSLGGGFAPGGGGGGGGHATAGAEGASPEPGASTGGAAYGSADFGVGLYGGMGGAGGGANGGGGGGGGGAISVFANRISVSGLIDVSGGGGGGKVSGGCTSGGGGGGGGGSIWLHADLVRVEGTLDAGAGVVAPVNRDVSLNAAGGSGASGRVRVSAIDRNVAAGTVIAGSTFNDRSYPECEPPTGG